MCRSADGDWVKEATRYVFGCRWLRHLNRSLGLASPAVADEVMSMMTDRDILVLLPDPSLSPGGDRSSWIALLLE